MVSEFQRKLRSHKTTKIQGVTFKLTLSLNHFFNCDTYLGRLPKVPDVSFEEPFPIPILGSLELRI